MKKILILGGADIQIPAIIKAKEINLYVITCDYLPENPGHQHAHEYHNVSTTNKEDVLELCRKLRVDGISSYASDPGALTAAYVSDHMKLPGNSFQTVSRLSDKVTFRSIQQNIGIPYPDFFRVRTFAELETAVQELKSDGIFKPVDTSGSKGIHKILSSQKKDKNFLQHIFNDAFGYSRSKDFIVEALIPRKGSLMSGDFIVQNGEILFMCFGDVHFNTRINGIVPRSISLPAIKPADFFSNVKSDLQKLVDSLSIRSGVFNVDVLEDEQGRPVLIDIGARNGGNLFNDIIFYHSDVNLIELSLKQCVGEPVDVAYNGEIKGYFAHNVLHTEESGTFEDIIFSAEIQPKIIFKIINKRPGDKVERFVNSSFRIGLILLKFDSLEQMTLMLSEIHKHVTVKVK